MLPEKLVVQMVYGKHPYTSQPQVRGRWPFNKIVGVVTTNPPMDSQFADDLEARLKEAQRTVSEKHPFGMLEYGGLAVMYSSTGKSGVTGFSVSLRAVPVILEKALLDYFAIAGTPDYFSAISDRKLLNRTLALYGKELRGFQVQNRSAA